VNEKEMWAKDWEEFSFRDEAGTASPATLEMSQKGMRRRNDLYSGRLHDERN